MGRRITPAMTRLIIGTIVGAMGIGAIGGRAAAAAEGPATVPGHGIAMHGEPALPAGFTHLDYADPDARPGGTVRFSVPGSFDSLHPFIVRGRSAAGTDTGHLVETLLARSWNEPFTLYGLIAATVATPPDRSSVRFGLRPEARWHDGTPITAADVLFSWQVLRDHGRPKHRSYYGAVIRAAAEDPRTVRFDFEPLADGGFDREMPLIMGLMPILPAAWWRDRPFDRTTLEPPLASGPYRIAALEPGRFIEYQKVADHWGRDLPVNRYRHNFATIRYDYYRDDAIALEAFKAGAVDFRREFDPGRWITGYAAPARADGRIVLERLPHGRPEPVRALIFNLRRPLFADRRVRLAFTHAFDGDWLNRSLYHGAYTRTESYYPNSELAARGLPEGRELAHLEPLRARLPPALFERPFALPRTDGSGPTGVRANLRTATALLAEAGYAARDGHLTDRDGQPVRFDILLTDPGDERVALEFGRGLARLGVTARVRTVDSAQYAARLETFDFDMTINYWISTLSPGNEQRTYFGSTAADQPGSRNFAGIRNPAADTLIAALAEAPDRAELVARARALDRVLSWEHYAIPLFHVGADLVAHWSRLRRPAVTPLYGIDLSTWWHATP